jgi:GNAT superfamily N-acetyltransferase
LTVRPSIPKVLSMSIVEQKHDRILISTDKHKLNLQVVFDFLAHESYWAQGRTLEIITKSIDNSLCFGVYEADKQVGFARVVTDYATFGWICDVFILKSHRQHGLGKRLIEAIVNHPDLTNIRRLLLATLDAHELYRRYGGFESLPEAERWMTRVLPSKK